MNTDRNISPKPYIDGRTIHYGKKIAFEITDDCTFTEMSDGKNPYFEVKCGSITGFIGYYAIEPVPGETKLETIHSTGQDKGGWIRWSESQNAEVHVVPAQRGSARYINLRLYIQPEEGTELIIAHVASGWYEDDMAWNQKSYDYIVKMIRMARVNGEPLPDHGLTGKGLMKLLSPKYDVEDAGRVMLPDERG